MRLRLIMFPGAFDLLEVFERLNAIDTEAEAARALKALIPQVVDTGSLPSWFRAMEQRPFTRARSKTIRYTLPDNHPALRALMPKLEPLESAKRDLVIQRLLRSACLGGQALSPQISITSATNADGATPSPVSGTKPMPLETLKPLEPLKAEPVPQELTDEERRQLFKKSLASFHVNQGATT